jgi:3-methyl-2-oxobutanoate hydroxymethyltransferase
VTVPLLGRFKRQGQPIAMVTAYDATFARLVDEAGVDVVLVGDSLGMVMQGHPHTLEVTLEHMAYHARCVRRAVQRAHLVVDMPFMSYQVSPEQALAVGGTAGPGGRRRGGQARGRRPHGRRRSAHRGRRHPGDGPHRPDAPERARVRRLRVQARDEDAAERLRQDALALQEAGAYSLVLEGIPAALARQVSAALAIPTIGIGAGPGCDGQVLVMQDLLGLDDQLQAQVRQALRGAGRGRPRGVRAVRPRGPATAASRREHSFAGEAAAPGGARVTGEAKPGAGGYGPG